MKAARDRAALTGEQQAQARAAIKRREALALQREKVRRAATLTSDTAAGQ